MIQLELREKLYLAAVVVLALLFAGLVFAQARLLLDRSTESVRQDGSAGRPRVVDQDHIQRLIREKRLSDHEASFYRKLPSPDSAEKKIPRPQVETGR
jgi:hypothetical protein